MEKRTRFNLLYLVLTLFALALLQSWWQQAQTVEVIPCSAFEDLLAEGRFSEITAGDRLIYTLQLRRGMAMEKAA